MTGVRRRGAAVVGVLALAAVVAGCGQDVAPPASAAPDAATLPPIVVEGTGVLPPPTPEDEEFAAAAAEQFGTTVEEQLEATAVQTALAVAMVEVVELERFA